MKIEHDALTRNIVISYEDRKFWRDGADEYWKTPKDDRPNDINVCEMEDNAMRSWYTLHRLGLSYGINNTPQMVADAIENYRKMAEICDKYALHVLALCIDPEGKGPERRNDEKARV